MLNRAVLANQVEHLYVHIPYCARKCPYCDFNSIANRSHEQADYVEALIAELQTLPRGPYRTIFIGGGTPTELQPQLLQRLVEFMAQHFKLAEGYEWTCEANPGSADEKRFEILAAAGVNRLSIGVQAVQDHHLKFLGRIHTMDEADRVVRAACSIMPRVSADLIIGLPNQSVAEVEDTIAWIGERRLSHASVYHLAIEPGTEFHALYSRGELQTLSQERSRVMLDCAWDALAAIGLQPYETSNFSRAGEECRHNIAYWRQRDYHAAGAGAVSTVAGVRVTRQPNSALYITAMHESGQLAWRTESLTPYEQVVEAWMLGLRLTEGVDLRRIQTLGDPAERWKPMVDALLIEQLVEMDGDCLRLSRHGRALQDNVTVRLIPDEAE